MDAYFDPTLAPAPIALSIVEGMSNAQYHARPEYSSSQLKDMIRSAAHFYSHNIAKEHEKERKACMDFGTLAHTLFLEPEQFSNEFVIAPVFDRRTKAGKEEAAAWEQSNEGKTLVTEEQVQGAKRIVKNLQTLSMYGVMQNNYGMAEASFFFTDPIFGLELRVRPDWHVVPCSTFPNGLILDLKTTSDARAIAFQRQCGNFAYDLSAAMYREGFQQVYGTENKPDFIFLVAENTAPFNVKQYKASNLFLSIGEQRYYRAKELLAESLLLQEWDGYSKELEEINLPSYMLKQALQHEFN
ncbi:PD-(D/E)XK nuclease-like domain-containing protein [Acinetobacter brisouii]|uniref:PD-(D/E)XK nuclease-like domain-containing protein n=1 Tax=Acinetobacter brisouii TaxID=396323 RepID=UPI001250C256|nr:PD-(D/E)XK nuclease-like domain-containing protein [Acinetobacter brisouii]